MRTESERFEFLVLDGDDDDDAELLAQLEERAAVVAERLAATSMHRCRHGTPWVKKVKKMLA